MDEAWVKALALQSAPRMLVAAWAQVTLGVSAWETALHKLQAHTPEPAPAAGTGEGRATSGAPLRLRLEAAYHKFSLLPE